MVREGQRGYRKLALAAEVESLPTGDQDLDSRACRQEVGHLGGGGQDVLKVVQDEEQMPIPQVLLRRSRTAG